MKFSIANIQDDNYKSFHTILNRNFENLIKKSIFFTHGLNLEKGELYQLSVIKNIYKSIEKFLPQLVLQINGKEAIEETRLIEKVVEKIIQDTIEERIILNFLHETKVSHNTPLVQHILLPKNSLLKNSSFFPQTVLQLLLHFSPLNIQ